MLKCGKIQMSNVVKYRTKQLFTEILLNIELSYFFLGWGHLKWSNTGQIKWLKSTKAISRDSFS